MKLDAVSSTVLLQAGKLHFGVILGWSVVGSMGVWFVVNNMAGEILTCVSVQLCSVRAHPHLAQRPRSRPQTPVSKAMSWVCTAAV